MRNMSFAKPDANYERFLAGKFAAAPQVAQTPARGQRA